MYSDNIPMRNNLSKDKGDDHCKTQLKQCKVADYNYLGNGKLFKVKLVYTLGALQDSYTFCNDICMTTEFLIYKTNLLTRKVGTL